ncbi:MAG: hypothetical protein RLZZ306_2168 [Bacteroidota bacterium]|jgi:transposase-like protein
MTAREQIREEIKTEYLLRFYQNGLSIELISKVFEFSIKKVEKIIKNNIDTEK